MINSIESQLGGPTGSAKSDDMCNTAQVIAKGQELLAHLELRAKSLEHEVADLMALTMRMSGKQEKCHRDPTVAEN